MLPTIIQFADRLNFDLMVFLHCLLIRLLSEKQFLDIKCLLNLYSIGVSGSSNNFYYSSQCTRCRLGCSDSSELSARPSSWPTPEARFCCSLSSCWEGSSFHDRTSRAGGYGVTGCPHLPMLRMQLASTRCSRPSGAR